MYKKIKTRVILEINIELTRLDTYKKVSLGFYSTYLSVEFTNGRSCQNATRQDYSKVLT